MLMISCTFHVEINWSIFIYLVKEDGFFLLPMIKMRTLKFVAPHVDVFLIIKLQMLELYSV